jgi:hypothetical protein
MYFVARLKIGDMTPEASPGLDPFSPEIIERVHGVTRKVDQGYSCAWLDSGGASRAIIYSSRTGPFGWLALTFCLILSPYSVVIAPASVALVPRPMMIVAVVPIVIDAFKIACLRHRVTIRQTDCWGCYCDRGRAGE